MCRLDANPEDKFWYLLKNANNASKVETEQAAIVLQMAFSKFRQNKILNMREKNTKLTKRVKILNIMSVLSIIT